MNNYESAKGRSMKTRRLWLVGIFLIALPVVGGALSLIYYISPEKIDLRIENVTQLDQRAQAAIEQAEAAIPPAQLPPAPQGQTRSVQRTEFKTVRIGGLRTRIPTVVTEKRFVGPTTDETARWTAEATEIRSKRAAAVEAEAERILTEQDRAARREEAKFWVAVLGPSASTLIGFVTLILTIRRDRRAEEKQTDERASHLPSRVSQATPREPDIDSSG